jgi:fatty acid desaturase
MAWEVRGKRYDLSKFKHPGGPIALGLAKGRDADDLIRSYHPFQEQKVRKILEKYEVKDAPPAKIENIFEPGDTKFSLELKKIAQEYFGGRTRVADTRRWIEYGVMAALMVLSLSFFVKGYWFALLTTPTIMWIFGVNTFHDASHFAISKNWAVNAFFTYLHPWFSSPTTWYYQHVVGHHPYVNIRGKDPDLNHASPLHRYMPWHVARPLHKYMMWTILFVWSVGTFIQGVVVDYYGIKKNLYQRVVPLNFTRFRRVMHFVARLATVLFVVGWPFFVFAPLKALVWAFVPWGIFSTYYLTISQVGHIVDEAIEPPADKDFYKHQVLHTHNFGVNSLFCFYISGGLNLQIEHHLFPGVNHCHLRKLAPAVKKLCKAYGIPYNESSGFFSALGKHVKLLYGYAVKG